MLKQLFTQAIQNKYILHIKDIDSNLLHYQDLLAVVETFDRIFLDSIWLATKRNFINEYLKEKGDRLLLSSNWKHNLLGLRCIGLDPKRLVSENTILPLLNHPKYTVRLLAGSAMVRAEKKTYS